MGIGVRRRPPIAETGELLVPRGGDPLRPGVHASKERERGGMLAHDADKQAQEELWTQILNGQVRGLKMMQGVVDRWDGIVDKFVGDEAGALFIPGFAGEDHAARAIA